MKRKHENTVIELARNVRLQLQRICLLRGMGVGVAILIIASARYGFDFSLPYVSLAITLCMIALISVVAWWRLQQTWKIAEQEVFIHLMIDVFGLFTLLYLSGGSTNPFVSLLLFPLIFSVTLLPQRYSWVMAGVTVMVYTVLLFWYVPLSEEHHLHAGGSSEGMAPDFRIHVIGMWVNFVISALLIATFAVRMMTSIRVRDKMLAVAREENLRHERIIAVGTLAAGAAHELGTPLSTIAVLCNDMQSEYGNIQDLRDNLEIIRTQVTQCKNTISALLANADHARPLQGVNQRFDQQIQRILDKWNLVRPNPQVKILIVPNSIQFSAPMVYFDQTLDQALINLLNNAADASPEHVEVVLEWNEMEISIKFCDAGPGLTQEALQKAGRIFFSSKAKGQGIGIGLYLTNATIERFGGKVNIHNQDGGGAIIHVTLPLIHLQVQDNHES